MNTKPEVKAQFTVRRGCLHVDLDEPIYDWPTPLSIARIDAKLHYLTETGTQVAPALMSLLDDEQVSSLIFRKEGLVVMADPSSFRRIKQTILLLIETSGCRAVERDGSVLRYRPRQCSRLPGNLRRTSVYRSAYRPPGIPVNDD